MMSIRFALLWLMLTAIPDALRAQRSALDSVNSRAGIDDYRRTGRARVVHSGTYVMVPYGHVEPTLQCAPARVCIAELERGERVIDSAAADPVRWLVDFATGPDSVPVIITKPVALPNACDLTTNLVVTTNRRVYHLTLDSPPCPGQEESTNPNLPYNHVKFYYPDDALVRHHGSVAEPAAGGGVAYPAAESSPPAGREHDALLALDDLGALHVDYQVIPDPRFPWVPRLVVDNGRQTCIRLPAQAYHSDLAVLYELTSRGDYEYVQYVVRDGCILTDRVARRMVLVIPDGSGRDPLRLLIVRQNRERR
jgi:type IV secretory pathway VirB9-like protein